MSKVIDLDDFFYDFKLQCITISYTEGNKTSSDKVDIRLAGYIATRSVIDVYQPDI